MLQDPLAFEDIGIRRGDHLAAERVAGDLKKQCTSQCATREP